MKLVFHITAGFFLFVLLLVFKEASGAELQQKLEGIKEQITREKQGLTEVERKEGSVLEALEKIDIDLDRRNARLKTIGSRLDGIIQNLQATEGQLAAAGLSVEERRELLKKRAQALYKWQRGGSPFILLNGGLSAGDIMRRKHYLELMLSEDQALLERLLTDSTRQKRLKEQLARTRENLDKERMTLVQAKESIRTQREKKSVILSSLRGEKEVRARALRELEQAASRLEKMIGEFDRRMTAQPKEAYPWNGFDSIKGRLDYPIAGKVVGAFGVTRHPEFSEKLFRKGIDIEAPLGEEIKTVERGKVVFADRFSGYGKMMIIDHGKRFYTVYAHLSELLKQPGDSVQKGEAIALVGDTGSLKGPRLYFEIRKDGKPVDPLPWFKKR